MDLWMNERFKKISTLICYIINHVDRSTHPSINIASIFQPRLPLPPLELWKPQGKKWMNKLQWNCPILIQLPFHRKLQYRSNIISAKIVLFPHNRLPINLHSIIIHFKSFLITKGLVESFITCVQTMWNQLEQK